MNFYLDSNDKDDSGNANVTCTRIRMNGSTMLRINVTEKDIRRPNEVYTTSESDCPDPEILYSVTDVSDVEQGQGGFVNAIKAMHNKIAVEETEKVRRDSARSEDLTAQLEGFLPALQKSANRAFRANSFQGTPREESKLTRSSTLKDDGGGSSGEGSTSDELSPNGMECVRAESEVVYSISDVSGIEPGDGGFVASLKARHESIGTENSLERSGSIRSSGRKPVPLPTNDSIPV